MHEDADREEPPDYPGHVGSGGGGSDDDSQGPEPRSWQDRESITLH